MSRFAEPFSGKPAIDPSEAMREQNYTVAKMFRTGDDFYAAMGLLRSSSSSSRSRSNSAM